ncbi:MAG TPA: outer membrane lipoprotein-sorting protein [Candidatus Acidoferrum sp.]|nr:outer membrane lipoprotein-sorting protein [Candidatus Acidoferrum sp.]
MTKGRLIPLIFALGAMAVAICAGASQTAAKWTTESVLEMMDRSAKDFRSLTADLENIKYTAVVKDTSTETGQIWVRHDQKMRIDITKPEPRTMLRTGNSLFLYNPKLNRVEEYDLGKNGAMVDQYARLGFGTKSEDLKKSYQVAVTGEEELDHKKTVVLELTPKSEQMRGQVTKVQMWVDEASWLPIQQKFYETGAGDYILFHYTNMMKNLKINESEFKQNWPKNASHEKPHV